MSTVNPDTPHTLHGNTGEVLADAETLAENGDFIGAITLASEHNRHHRDDALETRIAQWRYQAFVHQVHPRPRPDWPPVVTDPFPDCHGVPEIAASDLTVEALAGGISHHGCLLVRGLLEHAEAQGLADGIDAAFRAVKATRNHGVTSGWHTPFQTPADSHLGGDDARDFGDMSHSVWTADSPRMLFDLVETLERKQIIALIETYLGERPALSVGKSSLRRVPPTLRGTAWHQDGAFLGTDVRSVNLWLPLSHCGVDASAMDMVPRRIPHIVDTGKDDAIFQWCVGSAQVEEAACGTPIASPVFAPGDAMFFDHLFLHRTSLPPARCKVRHAIESWFFAPSGYPTEQVPLWL